MKTTQRDVAIHMLLGILSAALSIVFFIVKFDFKNTMSPVTIGGHFSLPGLIFAIVGGVLILVSVFGIMVLGDERKNNLHKEFN